MQLPAALPIIFVATAYKIHILCTYINQDYQTRDGPNQVTNSVSCPLALHAEHLQKHAPSLTLSFAVFKTLWIGMPMHHVTNVEILA